MPEALKDIFFKPQFFEDLAASVKKFFPAFDRELFKRGIFDTQWENLELKERVRHTTISLRANLPGDYREALEIIRKTAAEPVLKDYGFEKMVFADFIEVYGLDDYEASIPALEQFTCLISAEFAVRPFIKQYPQQMMEQMLHWSSSEKEDLRRLSSEGCRPRLPWAMALPDLKADPTPILPILENLKDDPSEVVRRSAANNLNDISKDNPQVMLDLLKKWKEENIPDFEKMSKQALRTLVKKGDPQALELLGFSGSAQVKVTNLQLSAKSIKMGETIAFSFELESTSSEGQNLVIDYIVHLVRSKGKTSQKVFKMSQKTLAPAEKAVFRKNHSFAAVTTRKYYPGIHKIELQINGQKMGSLEFLLEEE